MERPKGRKEGREREREREGKRAERKKRARGRERGNGPLAHPTMKQSGPAQMEGDTGQTFTLFTQVDYITELSLGDLLKVVFYPPHPKSCTCTPKVILRLTACLKDAYLKLRS